MQTHGIASYHNSQLEAYAYLAQVLNMILASSKARSNVKVCVLVSRHENCRWCHRNPGVQKGACDWRCGHVILLSVM